MKLFVFAFFLVALVSCGNSSASNNDYTDLPPSDITQNSNAWEAFEYGVEAVLEIVVKKFVVPDRNFTSTVIAAWQKGDSHAEYYKFEAQLVNAAGGKVSAAFIVKCKDDEKSLYSFKYDAKFPTSSDNNIDAEIEIEVHIENEAETENEAEVEVKVEVEVENENEVEVEVEVEVETENNNNNDDVYVPITPAGCYSSWLKNLIANGAKDVILADSKIPRASYQLTEVNTAEKKTHKGDDYYKFDVVLESGKNVLKVDFTLKVDSKGAAKVNAYKWWYHYTK